MENKTVQNKNNNWKYRHFFWSSWMIQASWNYERQMNMGYLFGMAPIIDKLYDENDPEQLARKKEAYDRHNVLFNCTPQTSSFIMGLTASMEETYAEDPESIDPDSITAIKTSLMGPLSGIGDSFFQGTIRIIAFGLGISLAQQGSILGPILAMIISFIPSFLITYYGGKLGYTTGNTSLKRIYEEGIMERVTYGLNVVGLTVIGAMIASLIGLTTPISYGEGFILQEVLDSIIPQLIPLLTTFLMYYFIRKNTNTIWLLVLSIVAGVLFSVLGILA